MKQPKSMFRKEALLCFAAALLVFGVCGCSQQSSGQGSGILGSIFAVSDHGETDEQKAEREAEEAAEAQKQAEEQAEKERKAAAKKIWETMDISKDYRKSFIHGEKPPEYQKYIILHDTEGDGDAEVNINYWDGNGKGVAAHFVVNKDGSIVQAVKMDNLTHHAGFGGEGYNKKFGVIDESRDDKVGTSSSGGDYGMNSYSIGIEMVHVGNGSDYPKAQLEALDKLISYIDTYYGFESKIICHREWAPGNSDTSKEFDTYLANYKDHRSYK